MHIFSATPTFAHNSREANATYILVLYIHIVADGYLVEYMKGILIANTFLRFFATFSASSICASRILIAHHAAQTQYVLVLCFVYMYAPHHELKMQNQPNAE